MLFLIVMCNDTFLLHSYRISQFCYSRESQYLTFVDPCIIVQLIKKNPTRCNNVSKFYYSIFKWNSACFGRHTAHRQEPKTALAASGFSYVEGCWTCGWWTCGCWTCGWWTLSGRVVLTLRWLMSYIYGAPILDVSISHTTTQHSR